MADETHITASFVFCTDSGIARAWNALEYGVDYIPYWSQVVGWVGPDPPEFIGNHGFSRSTLKSDKDAQDFYDEVCGQKELGGMHDQRYNLTTDMVKIVVAIKVDADGISEGYDQLKWSIENFVLKDVGSYAQLSQESMILIFQDQRPVEKTRVMAEEIRELLLKGHRNDPPKIFISTTANDQGAHCEINDLDDMAACILHFAVEQDSWNSDEVGKAGFLVRPQKEPHSQISGIGLRGFFWERIRAIDISRKEVFKNIANKWLEGDGWKIVKKTYPEGWPETAHDWKGLLWEEMKKSLMARTNLPVADSMGEEVVNVVGEVSATIREQLRDQLQKTSNVKKADLDKVIQGALNLISITLEKHLKDQFEVLPEAIERVKENTKNSFEEWQRDLLQQGVGLDVLRKHYATSIRAIQKIQPGTHAAEGDFDYTGIMGLASKSAQALVKIPSTGSSFFSTVTIFSFLLCLLFHLSQMVLGNGMLTCLLISTGLSLVVSVFIIYFYLKKKKDTFGNLLKRLNAAVAEMAEGLMDQRLDCALEEIIDGTDAEPGAKQLMLEQEKALIGAIEAGKRDLDLFKDKNKIPDEIKTFFYYSINPAAASYAPNWNQDLAKKTEQWADTYWENREFNGTLPDNFISQWQNMSEEHREYLLTEQTGHHLGVEMIRDNAWNTLKKNTFKEIPQQTVLNMGLVDGSFYRKSYHVYAPRQWRDTIAAHLKRKYGFDPINQGVQNKNAICIFTITDGLKWAAIMSPPIPEVFIRKGRESPRKLDLREVREQMKSRELSPDNQFLWISDTLSGGRTEEIKNGGSTTNVIVLQSHGLSTGEMVKLKMDKGGAQKGNAYYIHTIDKDRFGLYDTPKRAHDGNGGAVALTASQDISFNLHGNDPTSGRQGFRKKSKKWIPFRVLNTESHVLDYFPSIEPIMAKALADVIRQALKDRGQDEDEIPIWIDEIEFEPDEVEPLEDVIERGAGDELQQSHIDEIIGHSERIGREVIGEEFRKVIEANVIIVGSALDEEDCGTFISHLIELAGSHKTDNQEIAIENYKNQIEKAIGTDNNYLKMEVIKAQSDLFYTIALYDAEGFSDFEKEKISSFLRYWVSRLGEIPEEESPEEESPELSH
jgi:hypothetical protein